MTNRIDRTEDGQLGSPALARVLGRTGLIKAHIDIPSRAEDASLVESIVHTNATGENWSLSLDLSRALQHTGTTSPSIEPREEILDVPSSSATVITNAMLATAQQARDFLQNIARAVNGNRIFITTHTIGGQVVTRGFDLHNVRAAVLKTNMPIESGDMPMYTLYTLHITGTTNGPDSMITAFNVSYGQLQDGRAHITVKHKTT